MREREGDWKREMDAYVREDAFYSEREREREKDELLLRRLEQEDYSFRVGIGNLS